MVAGHASSIAQKVMGLGSSISAGGILGIIEETVGQLETTKKVEIEAELQTLLVQSQINQSDAQSNESFFYKGARPTLFWMTIILFGLHCFSAEIYNQLHALGYQVGLLAPLDNMVWLVLGGLAGIWAVGRTIEKVNNNQSDQDSSN
jgi:hypothetical protein